MVLFPTPNCRLPKKLLDEDDLYLEHLKTALTELKNNKVDMILFAADVGEAGTYFAFEEYQNAIDEVFGSNRPIIQTIMSNHDYWTAALPPRKIILKHLKEL